jgi:hypothetical protein
MREEKTRHVPYKYRAPGMREGGKKQWKKNIAKKKRQKTERTRERKGEKEPEQNTMQRREEEGTEGRKTKAEDRVFPATSAFINLRSKC